MKIDITSSSPRNVAQGISMIEESLMEFVSDENSEKKMLYELVSTAEGSYKVIKNDGFRIIYRDKEKEWWALFELPYHTGSGKHHGNFLTNIQIPEDCKMELFGVNGVPLEHASPFMLIRGTNKDVKTAVSAVRDKMRKHQGRGCNCTPKW